MGPITLIPVTENPGTEGQFLLTVQELSGAGEMFGDCAEHEDEDNKDANHREEERTNHDAQAISVQNRTSPTQIYLMAMPEGGGWRGKSALGTFLGKGAHAGSTLLHTSMTIPSPKTSKSPGQKQEDVVGTAITEWGDSCTFVIGRSTTSIVAILVADKAFLDGDHSKLIEHARFRLRIVRKWPSSKLDEVVADSGLCSIIAESRSSSDREVVCTATLLPNKDVSASSHTPENEVRYQIIPFIEISENWTESYSFPFEVRMYSDKQVLQRQLPREMVSVERKGDDFQMSDINSSFGASSDVEGDESDSIVVFRKEDVATQSHFAPIPSSEPMGDAICTKCGGDSIEKIIIAANIGTSVKEHDVGIVSGEGDVSEEDMEVLEVRGSPPPPLKLRGKWKDGIGGCFPNSASWRRNPQYQIEVPQRVRLMVVLERLSRSSNLHTSSRRSIGIIICTADDMPRTQHGFPRRVIALDRQSIVAQSPFVYGDKVVCEVELEGLDRIYAIIPSLLDEASTQPLQENEVVRSEPGEVVGPVVTRVQEDVLFELTLVTSSTIRVKHKPLLHGCAGDWKATSICGTWTSGNAGGCFNHSSWMLNPNFVLRCPRGHYVIVVLEAKDLQQSLSESLLEENKNSDAWRSKSLIESASPSDSNDGRREGEQKKS